MVRLIVVLLLIAGGGRTADEDAFGRAVMTLSGASCPEDLDEEALEAFARLRFHPLDLNAAGPGRLKSSGLLTPYQSASITDYRLHNGDILSFAELALVAGIGEEVAEALKFFVVLKTDGAVGERGRKRGRHSVMTRASARWAGLHTAMESSFGLKYAGEISDFLEIRYSDRTTYDDRKIRPGTFGVAYYGRRWLENAVIGDYNLRYGQGLLQWSGTTMTGVSTAAALKKNGTGVSPTGSFSGGRRGVAAGVDLGGGWGVSAALSLPGLRERMDGSAATPIGISPIAHASYLCSVAAFGATAFFERLPLCVGYGASFDWNAGIPALNFYGELAWSGRTYVTDSRAIKSEGAPALIAGVAWTPSYGHKYGLVIRYYPADYNGGGAGALRSGSKVADEHAVSAAATLKWFNSTVDFVHHPSDGSGRLKALLQASPEFRVGEISLKPSLRYAGRLKSWSDFRNDLRADAALTWSEFTFSARYNVVLYRNFSWLWYLDAAYGNEYRFNARWTLFKVDDWDDRIYCYERDNPGNFTVPAFYGRGWELYAMASCRIRAESAPGRRHDLGLRASFKTYPWNLTPKSPLLEFKLQYSIVF